MRSLIIIFASIIFIIAIPFIFDSIDDALTYEYTQSFAGVDTGASEFTANVTISRDIWHDDSASVISISSNCSADSPSVSDFNSVSREAEISGLDESRTRTLALIYLVDNPYLQTGAATFFVLLRWFVVFIPVGFAGGAIYAFFD